MNRTMRIAAVAAAMLALVGACDLFKQDVAVSFELTDAPIDPDLVAKVEVTISSVAVNESGDGTIADGDGSWIVTTISPPVVLDLLTLQNGIAAALGDALMVKGGTQINQIRLGVDSVLITETDTSEIVASIPSRTGLKIVNAFDVPQSGAVTITIDFDVRKSVVYQAGPGSYTLKPTLRAVVEGEAATIRGTTPLGPDGAVVYAYANGTWVDTEATTPNADGLYYTGAYTSALAGNDGTYTLAFLDAGTYDLVAGCPTTNAVLATLPDVAVAAGQTLVNQNPIAP